ncbi:MAG: class III extradiol ring-cleavage dioxygenase [Acidobacteriota bacterium]
MPTPETGNERRALRIRRVPSLFVAHGSPLAVVDKDYAATLRAFGARQKNLRAIIVVSAHWQTTETIRVSSSPTPHLIYDFSGFPSWLYNYAYQVPGDRSLAQTVAFRLQQAGVEARLDPERGFDHGVWVPLSVAFPALKVPVVQVSLPLPSRPDTLAAMGKALAPFRTENVLLVGSGGLVHNLARLAADQSDSFTEPWATAFDSWAREQAGKMDAAALADYQRLAPDAATAVPTSEHYDPLLFVMGSALPGDSVMDVYDGFRYGSLSMRSFALVGRRREDRGY